MLRFVLQLPVSASLAYQAAYYAPKLKATARRMAGGWLADDEAALEQPGDDGDGDSSGDEGEGEARKKARKKAAAERAALKPLKGGPREEVLVYDHHGDLLSATTAQAYLARNFTLHYEVERVLPPKRAAAAPR